MDRFDQKFLSIKEAARYLGVSVATLRRWDNEGSFKASFVTPGGQRRYALSDLEMKTKGLFRLAQEWAQSEIPTIPENAFYCATSDRFKARHERMANEIVQNDSWQQIASLISSATGEIGNNSFDHNLGNWPDSPGVFFAYDFGKKHIVLADRGVGLLTTLRLIKPDLSTHQEALCVAFTEVLTGRAPEHRGNGLKYVRSALTLARANLTYQSGDALLEIRKDNPDLLVTPTNAHIRGTLSFITF